MVCRLYLDLPLHRQASIRPGDQLQSSRHRNPLPDILPLRHPQRTLRSNSGVAVAGALKIASEVPVQVVETQEPEVGAIAQR
jgi:hypothetical protein